MAKKQEPIIEPKKSLKHRIAKKVMGWFSKKDKGMPDDAFRTKFFDNFDTYGSRTNWKAVASIIVFIAGLTIFGISVKNFIDNAVKVSNDTTITTDQAANTISNGMMVLILPLLVILLVAFALYRYFMWDDYF